MEKQTRADGAMALTILVLGSTLAATGTAILRRWVMAGALRHSIGFEDALGAVVAIVGIGVVIWCLASMMLAFASAILYRGGRRRLADAAGSLSPAFMRRLAATVLGLNLLSVPLAHAALPVDPLWHPPASVSTAVSTSVWTSTTAPVTPPDPSGLPLRSAVNPLWQPAAPMTAPGPLAPAQLRTPSWFLPRGPVPAGRSASDNHASPRRERAAVEGSGQHAPAEENTVVVLAGDTLWTIAARALGPFATDVEIAVQWPIWFQTNRAIIGSNPNVLYPGQILQAP